MNIGQTVFYRISREDAEAVNRRREPASLRLRTGSQWHVGDTVEVGELLPACVVRCYSQAETGHDQFGDPVTTWEGSAGDINMFFSGIADIRVILPGNDVLYVHHAAEDMSPLFSPSGKGHGNTALPDFGKFTQSSPGSLL